MAEYPLIHLQNVGKTYAAPTGTLAIFQDINLCLSAGETVAIIGPSGAGKSTLLHMAGLLDTPTSGRIEVAGQDVTTLRDTARAQLRNTLYGFVYQHHHLLREFTALENVQMPARIAGVTYQNRPAALLAQVGLTDRVRHYPHQLSGGEKQRVAIARALMNQPQLLLADEPTGNLDATTASQVEDLLFQQVIQHNMSLLLVTHNPALAAKCQRTFTLQNGVLI